MNIVQLGAIIIASICAASCDVGRQCEMLNRAQAIDMALTEKAVMLRRSTAEHAANFESNDVSFVELGAETNGYAAKVGFRGRDGRTLIALIEGDCYIGWTERAPTADR